MSDRSAFHYGEVRRFLLEAIAEQPRHGYALIGVIAERVGPDHGPRPGTVYPRLTKLADDGLITGTKMGRRVVYTITDCGREELAGAHAALGATGSHVRARDAIGFGELRQRLLDAIAEQPRHGYELIRVIAETGSGYRPRPGSVYPRLTKLEDEGLITGTRVGRRVVYTITDRGREDITVPAATSRRASAETRRAEPEGKGAQLSTEQRVLIKFVRDVNEEIAVYAKRGDLSPETIRRLETELNRAHEAIARRLGRP